MREVTLQVESNANAPRISRSHLVDMRPSLEPRYDDVLLLVSELVSNSVRHSSSEGIDVRVVSSDGQIRIEVTDGGPGFDHGVPRGDGMGLSIIEKISDRWGLREISDRFTVWAEIENS